MEFPGFDNLFEIYDPLSNRAFRGGWETEDDELKLLRGEISPRKPVVIPWYMGSATPYDVIWTGMASPMIVSNRIIELLQQENITGWSTYDVMVTGKKGEEIPGYSGLACIGRCAFSDPGMSEIILKEYPGGWFPNFKGTYFPADSWDGSDMFGPSVGFYCTRKVYQLFKKAKIANIRFERLSETERDVAIWEIGQSDMLPPDYHQRVAHAYRQAGLPVPAKYAR